MQLLVDPECADMADSERKARALLKQRTPQEWAAAVRRINNKELRERVACVVWWDYFGGRKGTCRWTHLDRYVTTEKTPAVSIELLRWGLIAVGYSPHAAHVRLCETNFIQRHNRRETHVRI